MQLATRTFSAPFTESLIWHVRHEDDPAHRWLRELVEQVFRELLEQADMGCISSA